MQNSHRKEQLKYFCLILVVIFFLSLNSCSEYSDINNSNIFTSLFVDVNEKENLYEIGGTIVNVKSDASKSAEKSLVVYGSGETLNEARMSLDTKLSNESFYGALRSVLITNKYAKEDIKTFILRLKHQLNSRLTVPIYTTNQDYNDILTADIGNDYSIPFELEGISNTLQQNGYGIRINVSQILEKISLDIGSYIIPNMSMSKKDDVNKVYLQGYSIFKDNKMIDNIPFKEAVGLQYILSNKAVSTHYTKDTSVYCGKTRDKYIVSIKNNKLYIDYFLKVKGEIVETSLKEVNQQVVDYIQKSVNSQIEKEIENTFKKCFSLNADYLNITKKCIAKDESVTHEMINSMLGDAYINIQVDSIINTNYIQ